MDRNKYSSNLISARSELLEAVIRLEEMAVEATRIRNLNPTIDTCELEDDFWAMVEDVGVSYDHILVFDPTVDQLLVANQALARCAAYEPKMKKELAEAKKKQGLTTRVSELSEILGLSQ